jgi:hypothetical protein
VRGAHPLSSAERGAVQDSKRKPASEGHSRPVERRVRDWSGQRKKASQRGALTFCRTHSEELVRTEKKASQRRALTFCRVQSKGLVRTTKETRLARGTHILSSAERGTAQDSARKSASEEHSRPVQRRARDWSGQQNNANQRGGLTFCRAQSDGLVRTATESQPARGTHPLSGAERGTGQDSERKPASDGHSRTVEHRARSWSGQRKKASQRGAFTFCRAQNEGLVRTAKESQPASGTHFLWSTERGTGQDSERKLTREGHSPTVEHRTRDCLGQREQKSKPVVLTNYRVQSEELVRTTKENQPASGTHGLSNAETGTAQDSERKPGSEEDSRSVEHRARDWSGQRKKASQRQALTFC